MRPLCNAVGQYELPLKQKLAVRAVPLYDSLGESAVEYTVNHSETSIIFAEASKMEFLAKAAGAIKKSVKQVVFWGSHACTDGASATVKKEVCSYLYPLHFLGRSQVSCALPQKYSSMVKTLLSADKGLVTTELGLWAVNVEHIGRTTGDDLISLALRLSCRALCL